MATCLCAVLDQTTGDGPRRERGAPAAAAASAPDGAADFCGGATGVPLGVRPFTTYGEERFTVEPGDTLVLFTDGLVERRGEPIDDRLDLLADRARDAVADGRRVVRSRSSTR